ncbi:glycosyltransferase family 4 protein, partial [Megasphaera massiliensis]
MVTVGNRLDAEMSESFIDLICKFINNTPNVKWLLVGSAKHKYIHNKYNTLINNNQIIMMDYISDLPALYNICNIYINPFRQAGGFSGYMAMNQSLPIVTLYNKSDIGAVVGANFACKDIETYEQELHRLYTDNAYFNIVSTEMKRRVTQNY